MDNLVTRTVQSGYSRLGKRVGVALGVIVVLEVILFVVLFAVLGRQPLMQWLPELALASVLLFLLGAIVLSGIGQAREMTIREVNLAIGQELHDLRVASDRAFSLQAMASTLSATLSFERVVEQALDVCSLALEEMGIPRESLVGAIFLYEEGMLRPIASRRFLGEDDDIAISGTQGAIGTAMRRAEPVVTNNPPADPELQTYAAFQDCLTAVCVPLRAGFQLFGVMVIATDTAVQFEQEHFDLFSAVGDQTVIALQNAQLYQRLEAEKHRLIEADEDARKDLARDLHDGPTQSIAVIAMRVNFVSRLIDEDPERAKMELEKIEDLSKRTSADVRDMLFTLRPLVLETQGLGPALDTLIKRYGEETEVNMQLVGSEVGELLDKTAQSVVFFIVEEALNNARKYSEATEIEVRFWQADDLFAASVTDNGIGFDTYDVERDYSTRGSLGMINMRERAERIDGSLNVESSPDEGTTVTLVVPLEKHGRIVPTTPPAEHVEIANVGPG